MRVSSAGPSARGRKSSGSSQRLPCLIGARVQRDQPAGDRDDRLIGRDDDRAVAGSDGDAAGQLILARRQAERLRQIVERDVFLVVQRDGGQRARALARQHAKAGLRRLRRGVRRAGADRRSVSANSRAAVERAKTRP